MTKRSKIVATVILSTVLAFGAGLTMGSGPRKPRRAKVVGFAAINTDIVRSGMVFYRLLDNDTVEVRDPFDHTWGEFVQVND